VVHMVQEGQEIPFDLIASRAVFYNLSDLDRVEATISELTAHASAALSSGSVQDNPLVAALDAIALRESANPFAETLAQIQSTIAVMRQDVLRLEHNVGVIEKIKVFDKAVSTLQEADAKFDEIREALEKIDSPFYDIDDVMSKLDDIETAVKAATAPPA
jgi:phage shock protein A